MKKKELIKFIANSLVEDIEKEFAETYLPNYEHTFFDWFNNYWVKDITYIPKGGNKMSSNTMKKAEKEFDILSKTSKKDNRYTVEGYKDEILALVDKFGNSGQSGGSAPYTAKSISSCVEKLCLQNPISPLTGEEDEWGERHEGVGYQNQRESAVFKDNQGVCSYLNAISWRTQKSLCWSGRALTKDGTKICSCQIIKSFPFTPKTFVIDVIEEEIEKDDWEFYIKDESQLKEVFEYYNELKK